MLNKRMKLSKTTVAIPARNVNNRHTIVDSDGTSYWTYMHEVANEYKVGDPIWLYNSPQYGYLLSYRGGPDNLKVKKG